MKVFSMLLVAVSVLGVSCERHEFDGPDGTKQLHPPHGAGHATAGHEAGGEHGTADGHGTTEKAEEHGHEKAEH